MQGMGTANSRSKRADFRPERADSRPERAWGGQTDGRTDGRNEEQKSPCVLQDFVSSGAAAQKKEKRVSKIEKKSYK